MKRMAKVFVYGTLQPKGSLHSMLRTVTENYEPATLNNYALYKHPFGLYPEITKDLNRKVKGTLMDVQTNTEDFLEVLMMEVFAGYSVEVLEVRTNHGLLINALTFVASKEPKGFLIESGDWLQYEKSLLLKLDF
jgi:gamma-glutamylcyclotransferase (GGCT)/AIG2-like uncharacterized protein YtfP